MFSGISLYLGPKVNLLDTEVYITSFKTANTKLYKKFGCYNMKLPKWKLENTKETIYLTP